jgi:hypothetical protein
MILGKKNIINLEEYTIGSSIGSELTDLYKKIISSILEMNVNVFGKEISDGKYEIVVTMPNNKNYFNISKGWFTRKDVKQIIIELLDQYFDDVEKEKLCKVISSDNSINEIFNRGIDIHIVIMLENQQFIETEVYTDEEDAIESFENWIEVSYEDYLSGYKVENKYVGSRILRRQLILDKVR